MFARRGIGSLQLHNELPKGIDMDEFSARRLRNVIPALLEQRHVVVSGGASFAGYLIDLAIMQVRLALHDISEEELHQFSNALSDGLLEREQSE